MSDDLWHMPIQDLILNAAQVRAVHYRQQAIELREMAADEADKLRHELLELAGKYDALADSASLSSDI